MRRAPAATSLTQATPTGRGAGRQDDGRSGRRAGRHGRRLGRLLLPVLLVVVTAAVLGIGVLPTRSFLEKRGEVQAAEAELAAVREANAEAEAEAAALDTDAEIERRAREEFGLAKPGEETYVVLPPPADPVEVPDGWPFTELRTRLHADD